MEGEQSRSDFVYFCDAAVKEKSKASAKKEPQKTLFIYDAPFSSHDGENVDFPQRENGVFGKAFFSTPECFSF